MRNYTYKFDTSQALKVWLNTHEILDSHSVLFQIFSGILDFNILHDLTKNIIEVVPNATIIGTTTGGEVIGKTMQDNSIVISMSIFENTTLKSIHLLGSDSQSMGSDIAKNLIEEDTKCVIMFADGLLCNGDAILRGFSKYSNSNVVVSGGMSGDNMKFEKTYCIHGNEIFSGGVVAVGLSNPTLEVFHTYNLSWKPIGKKMIVSKSKDNILYEVDNQPIKKIYAKYLGKNVVKEMPSSTIEFPLISQQHGINVARSMISLATDEGIIYAGELPVGTEVRFGVGSLNMMTKSIHESYELASSSPIEGLFVYSCIARKAFLAKDLEAEFEPLSKIAPLCGFFTYGEFYHAGETNKLLNVTTTVLGLSETKEIKKAHKEEEFHYSSLTINALMNLVEVTMKENEDYANELMLQKEAYQAIYMGNKDAIAIADTESNFLEVNPAYMEMTGMSEEELLATSCMALSAPHDVERSKKVIAEVLEIGFVKNFEKECRTKSGKYIHVNMSISLLHNPKRLMLSVRDVTKLKNAEKQLKLLASTDPLTKLYNRRHFTKAAESILDLALRNRTSSSIIMMDIDNFKMVNDTYGHKTGDRVIITLASILKKCSRGSDIIARWGGEEFIILLPETDLDGAVVISQKIRETTERFILKLEDTNELKFTISIGVSKVNNDEEMKLESSINRADKALYEAKESGKNRVCVNSD